MKEIIDIHTHITPGIDDGAGDMEMSLEMLRSEAAQGCKKVLLTPHSSAFGRGGPEIVKHTCEQMKRVQKEAAREGIPVQVFTGCEIYTTRSCIDVILQDLINKKCCNCSEPPVYCRTISAFPAKAAAKAS